MNARQLTAARVKARLLADEEPDADTRSALRSLAQHYRDQHAAKKKKEDLLNRFHLYVANKARRA